MRRLLAVVLSVLAAQAAGPGSCGEAKISGGPTAIRPDGGKVEVRFAVSAPTDVEVAILDASRKAVRHLAAGVLGGGNPPPAPLKRGFSQSLEWNMKDDFGQPATGGPFWVRVRAGTGVKFGRFIGGDDPYTFGQVASTAVDARGNLYVMGFKGQGGHNHMTLRIFDAEGGYLRTIMPFPADLAPGRVGDLARWDPTAEAFRPKNIINRSPSFYEGTHGNRGRGSALRLFSASEEQILLTDGRELFRLDRRGGVPEGKFRVGRLWSGKPPRLAEMSVALSPDAKCAYVTGPRSAKSRYGHKYDPRYPPGLVYRLKLDGAGPMERFAAIDVAHEEGNGGAYLKNLGGLAPQYAWGRPLWGVAADRRGRVYVADREHQRVVVFDGAGKQVGQIDVKCPAEIAVHPTSGAIYVLQKARLAWRKWLVNLLKFEKVARDARPAITHPLPSSSKTGMFLWTGRKEPLIVLTRTDGFGFKLLAMRDAADTFEPVATRYRPRQDSQWDWQRLAADYERDEVYGSDGAVGMWRYDGRTGQGESLGKREREPGCPYFIQELAVGYHGLIYARIYGGKTHEPYYAHGYSGPFVRLTHDLRPAPYPQTGTHVLSPYIYSRQGTGYAERGFGIAPDGKVYISWMFPGWVKYAITGFGPDGKPLEGKYLVGKGHPANYERGTPKELNSAIIGPITGANGGLRVDLEGNLYVGLWLWPKGRAAPGPFKSDMAYLCSTGSVVKFSPEGGFMSVSKADWGSDPIGIVPRAPDGNGIDMRSGFFTKNRHDAVFVEGALAAYPGYGPFSHTYFGGNTCCVCRSPRFDLDRYGRLYLPNAITNSVRIVDNAGNLILEFGKYGNFDSRYVNPNTEKGKRGEPTVAVPEIPLGWPTATGVSERHIYVCDTYNRRAVRADYTYADERIAAIAPERK